MRILLVEAESQQTSGLAAFLLSRGFELVETKSADTRLIEKAQTVIAGISLHRESINELIRERDRVEVRPRLIVLTKHEDALQVDRQDIHLFSMNENISTLMALLRPDGQLT